MSNLGNKETFAKNLQYYMAINNMTRNDLCEELNFPYTTVVGWLTAKKYPRIDRIEKMAKRFGVTKADLIEERKPAVDYHDELTRRQERLNKLLMTAPREQREMLLDMIEAALKSKGIIR